MAFQQGLSGLSVSAKSLDVISNNIANASTVGFKGGQAQFADVYAASLGIGGSSQVGIGASLPVVQQQFTQGNISNSNNPLDIAINGSGFFRVQKSPTDQTITYTRNGQYHLDEEGYIVNAQNFNLTGYPITNGVTNRAQLVPVMLDTTGVVPRATGAGDTNPGVMAQINLDDRETRSLTSTTSGKLLSPWSANTSFPPNNLNTFNYSTSVTVYDTRGNDHALSMYFTRIADSNAQGEGKNLWEVHYVLDSTDITSCVDPATSPYAGDVPTLQFNENGLVETVFTSNPSSGYIDSKAFTVASGALTVSPAPTITAPATTATITVLDSTGTGYPAVADATGAVTFTSTVPADGTVYASYKTDSTNATNQFVDYKFNINIADLEALPNSPFQDLFGTATIPIDFSNSTLFGSGYDVNRLVQDGYPYGRLSGVSVSSEGVLRGNYSNGQTKDIAQLVLVDFISPTGLLSMGNNQWAETSASGQPLVGDPGSGNRGLLQAAAVEEANVDLTQELVNLITQQRNYQANAQSIKTQDQVLQTLVNLR